jgi:hypothetical protein
MKQIWWQLGVGQVPSTKGTVEVNIINNDEGWDDLIV